MLLAEKYKSLSPERKQEVTDHIDSILASPPKPTSIELQKVDCNCNDCTFLTRNVEKYRQKEAAEKEFQKNEHDKYYEKEVEKAQNAIASAKTPADRRSCEGLLRKVEKLAAKFIFKREALIAYGNCTKFNNKEVTFIPNLCQLDTQQCFKHRKD